MTRKLVRGRHCFRAPLLIRGGFQSIHGTGGQANREINIMTIQRIPASEVRDKITNDSALLVCAYDDDAKFTRFHLAGAMSMKAFKSISRNLEKEKEIFFYCA